MAQTFEKTPAPWHIAGRAWQSTASALVSLLPFYAVMVGLMFALGYGIHLLEPKFNVIPPSNDTLTNEMATRDSWFFTLAWGARVLLLVPAALAAMRYVLVDDGPRLAPGPLLRLWAWIAVLGTFTLGSFYLSAQIRAANLLLVGMVMKGFAVAIPVLLSPAFPALAADAPKGRSRIESALEDWDRNLWRMVFAFCLTVGVAVLLARLPAMVISRSGGADAVQAYHDGIANIVVDAVVMTLITVLVAATLAWWHAWARQSKSAMAPVAAQAQL